MLQSTGSPAIIGQIQVYSLHSTVVRDHYELAVWLPPGYDTSTHYYSTLYLLDAPTTFGLAVPIVLGQMWDGFVPEMIVVGIGKHIQGVDEWWPIRNRDYAPVPLPGQPNSGRATAFLKCVQSELIPFIDTHFRTDPKDRVLWGHSLGGTFVLFTLFHESNLFHRYIATSPAVILSGETLIDTEVGLAPSDQLFQAHLFVSVGSLDQEHRPSIETLIMRIESRAYRGLQFKSRVLDGFGHPSALPPGFIHGLQAVFSKPT